MSSPAEVIDPMTTTADTSLHMPDASAPIQTLTEQAEILAAKYGLEGSYVASRVRRLGAAFASLESTYTALENEFDQEPEKVTPLTPAQQQLVGDNLGLVGHVMHQVSVNFPKHVDRDELISAGMLGLTEAALRFDDNQGATFSSFAAHRIRGAILDHVRAFDWSPRSVRKEARRLEAAQQELTDHLGRAPTDRELAEKLEIPTSHIDKLKEKEYRGVVLGLDHHLNDGDEDLPLVEVLPDTRELDPSEQLEGREMMAIIRDGILLLPPKHQHVIIEYFLKGRPSEEIADDLGVTESRISQIRTEALQKLRHGAEAQFQDDDAEAEQSNGVLARRRGAYAVALAQKTPWKDRIS